MKKSKWSIMDIAYYFIPILIIILAWGFCYGTILNGNDFWWHIKTGEWICKNKAIPRNDIFSWYGVQHNFEWTAHEWLAEVFLYAVFHVAGEKGIVKLCMLLSLIFMGIIYYELKNQIKNNFLIVTLFLGVVTICASVFFYGRPYIFSYFFIYVELKILYIFYENNQSKLIYLLPFQAILWSNIHGGSSNLSYILPVIFLIAMAVQVNYGRFYANRAEKKTMVKLLVICFCNVAALFVNPVGIRVVQYPYYIFNDKLQMQMISEWASIDFKNIGVLFVYVLPVLLMGIGLLVTEKQIRVIDLLLAGIFIFLLLRSVRFAFICDIVLVLSLARYIPPFEIEQIQTMPQKILLTICMSILLIGGMISVGKIGIKIHKGNDLISKEVTQELVQQIKEQNVNRLYTDYNLGGDLLYNDVMVFVDSRADLYAKDHVLDDAVGLMELTQCNTEMKNEQIDVSKLIQKYMFDSYVLLKSRPLYVYLTEQPQKYKLVYEDENNAFFIAIKKENQEDVQ